MAPPAPAKAAKTKGPPATGIGPIFKWDGPNPVPWTKDLVLTLKQTVGATPLDPKNQPYLMVYEADKDVWNDKGLGPDKKLEPIVSVQGNFSEEGVFTVSKTIPIKPNEHCCTAELRLVDKDGKPIKLKDKDGADLARLVIDLRGADLDDDTWELDVALRSSKDKERRQDRLVVTLPGMAAVLKDPSKYKDDRFDDDGKLKHAYIIQPGARRSYELFYVHCMSNPGKEPAEWFGYGPQVEIFAAASVGAHYIITRDGTIHHLAPNHRPCKHAGGGLRSGVEGNFDSIGVELTGLVDDIGVPLYLCRALANLALSPPALSGTLGAELKAQLTAAAELLCYRAVKNGDSQTQDAGTSTFNRCKKMIAALATRCSDANLAPLAGLFVPANRKDWNPVLSPRGDTREIANRAVQKLYAHALLGSADGLELKAAKKASVTVKDGKATATADVDMDTSGEGITLYRMKKGESFPGREAAGGADRFATVPKAQIVAFCKAQLDGAIDDDFGYGPLRPFLGMSDADFAGFIGYTDAQYKALADITQAIHRVYQFKTIVTHHYAAEKRKRDPGVQFDWDKYLGHAFMADLRAVAAFEWDAADDKRKPKGFAERTHTGKWPA